MPTWKNKPIYNVIRDKILKYADSLPKSAFIYKIIYYEGEKYFNLDLSTIQISARNDAEAVIILLDYLNEFLDVASPRDHYEDYYEVRKADGYDSDDSEDNYDFVKYFVSHQFDNDTLWLKKITPKKTKILKLIR